MRDGLPVCRAPVGIIAPSIGVVLDETEGVTGACLSTGKVLNCSDAGSDLQVDSSLCRELNIGSILVVPILGGKAVSGWEVLSRQPDAFNATHVR